ncbi:MAG TPA: SigB/SigF/SigG family RNA polymerase sigma factor [Thermoleophilaceae bacterium]
MATQTIPARRRSPGAGRHSTPIPTRARCEAAREDPEARLFARYRRDGDPAARRELIERFLPLARRLAARYQGGGEPLDDLAQVASLGLVKAVDGFDPSRGLRFSSYAVPTILGELRRHFRNTTWSIHVPRGIQERTLRVNEAIDYLSTQLGESPPVQAVAAEVGLTVEEVLEAMEARAAHETASLDSPVAWSDDAAVTLGDSLGREDSGFELVEDSMTVNRALRTLPERQRVILHLRFAEDLTQREIAERTGISQMHVSRLIRQALEQVRDQALSAPSSLSR